MRYWTLSYFPKSGRQLYCVSFDATPAQIRDGARPEVTDDPSKARRFDSEADAADAIGEFSGYIVANIEPFLVELPLSADPQTSANQNPMTKKTTENAIPSPIEAIEKGVIRSLGAIEALTNYLRTHKEAIEACLSPAGSYVNFSGWIHTSLNVDFSLTFHRPADAVKLTRVMGGKWERVHQDNTWFKYEGLLPIGIKATIYEAELIPQPQKLMLGDEGTGLLTETAA